METFIAKLIGDIEFDVVISTLFTISLFFAIMWSSHNKWFNEFFISNATKSLSITYLFSAYIIVCYSTFAGVIAIQKGLMMDIPFNAALLVAALMGIKKFGDAQEFKSGGQ